MIERVTELGRRVSGAARRRTGDRVVWLLPRRSFVRFAYRAVLGRAPDRDGLDHHVGLLSSGTSRQALLALLRDSDEAAARPAASDLVALHRSRQAFVRSLPAARRILDLGGTSLTDERGALVGLGYPYSFEQVTIVDLPNEARHEGYLSEPVTDEVITAQGPVRYRYHSMDDLSGIEDGSIDLVYSGQSFEHVTPEAGHRVLAEAHRVLGPGGYLCLDTPNRLLTERQLRGSGVDVIDPDHCIEYTHAQMLELFAEHGFEVCRAHGLGLMRSSAAEDRFDPDELRRGAGMFDDVDSSYLLAYVCRAI